jgi:hypothetical protein
MSDKMSGEVLLRCTAGVIQEDTVSIGRLERPNAGEIRMCAAIRQGKAKTGMAEELARSDGFRRATA